jgi:hypothetical protein
MTARRKINIPSATARRQRELARAEKQQAKRDAKAAKRTSKDKE